LKEEIYLSNLKKNENNINIDVIEDPVIKKVKIKDLKI